MVAATAAIVLVLGAHETARGDTIDLNPGVAPFQAGGSGTGRSVYVRCEENFTISSVGIRGALVPQSYDVVIYAGNGVSAAPGPALATRTLVVGNNIFGWNDITIYFFFQAGKEYIINWRPTTSNNTWSGDLEYYIWGNDPADDVDLGPVLLMDGREGHTAAGFSNTFAAHLRVERVIPEVDLHPDIAIQALAGVGTGRSIYFTADEDFIGTSIGIRGDFGSESHTVVIYQGAGVNSAPGPILAFISAVRGGGGMAWYDIPIDFVFRGGQDYIVHWRPVDGAWDAATLEFFLGWGNSAADDFDMGPLTVRDGREGFNSESFSNTAAPRMRIKVAPCLDLHALVTTVDAAGPGTGRSMYVTCDNNVRLRGVGIFGDLVSQSFDVVIFQGAGVSSPPGGTLHSATATRGGSGFGWNDISVDYVLQAGQDYIIHWRPTTSNNTWGTNLRYFPSWGNPAGDDRDLGPITIRDGREGHGSDDFANTFAPLMRVKYAPLCVADLNDSGSVDVFDLFLLLGGWGSSGVGADLAPANNVIDVFDLFVLLGAWGPCP